MSAIGQRLRSTRVSFRIAEWAVSSKQRPSMEGNCANAVAGIFSFVLRLRLKIGTYDQAKRLIFVYDSFLLRNGMHE
jgi:hypothetical protein